jgi:ribosomal protein S6
MKSKENKITESEKKAQIYEVGYLLLPSLPQEEIGVVYTSLKDLVLELKGELVSDEMPKLIDLSYMISKVINNIRTKFINAYFGWIKFEMNTDSVSELKNKLSLNENVLRFLIFKTVRENTIASKKFSSREGGFKKRTFSKKEENNGESIEINKEEIDKEIDAMVSI